MKYIQVEMSVNKIIIVILLLVLSNSAYASYQFDQPCELTGIVSIGENKLPYSEDNKLNKYNTLTLDEPIYITCDDKNVLCSPADNLKVVLLTIDDSQLANYEKDLNNRVKVSGILYRAVYGENLEGVFIKVKSINSAQIELLPQNVDTLETVSQNNNQAKQVAAKRPSSIAETQKKDIFRNIESDLYMILAIILACIGILLLVAGAFRKVVIYYDTSDMVMSLVAGLFLIFVYNVNDIKEVHFFASEFMNILLKWTLVVMCYLGAVASTLITFKNAIYYNKNIVIGTFIGLFKLLFIAITSIVMVAQGIRILEQKSGRDILVASFILGVFGSLVRIMINGQEVYERKGWQVPEDSRS
jgi:hypothetical protein